MTKQITKVESKEVTYAGFGSEEIQLIKETVVPSGTSDVEFKAFLMLCNKKRLDPFQRQIYLIPRWDNKLGKNKMVPQTSVDGFRAIAARTGVYAGCDDVVFDSEIAPKKASVTVYRLVSGLRCSFTASARWDQYYPGDKMGMMWKKMPHVMLGKVAEALALRKAFPEDLSGLYTDDEMQQAVKAPTDSVFIPAGTTHVLTPEGTQVLDKKVPETNQVDEETKEARSYVRERLIGKYGIYAGKVKEARAWIQEQLSKTFEDLTADDCQELIAKLDAMVPSKEELPPLSEEEQQQEIFK